MVTVKIYGHSDFHLHIRTTPIGDPAMVAIEYSDGMTLLLPAPPWIQCAFMICVNCQQSVIGLN